MPSAFRDSSDAELWVHLQETPQMARGSSLGQEGPRSRSGVSAAESSRGSREHTRGEPQELSSRSHTGDFQELASRSHTGASTERAQLSPSLMQRIQKVKQNALTPSSSQARELSGWGSGIPNAAQVGQHRPWPSPTSFYPCLVLFPIASAFACLSLRSDTCQLSACLGYVHSRVSSWTPCACLAC